MKTTTTNTQKENLNNALRHYNFNEKYFIQTSDKRLGKKYAIVSKTDNGGLIAHTNYMDYEQMNCYLFGYQKALTNQLL